MIEGEKKKQRRMRKGKKRPINMWTFLKRVTPSEKGRDKSWGRISEALLTQ